MRRLLFLLLLFISVKGYSQISYYTKYEVTEQSVSRVESMKPEEIKTYNELLDSGTQDTIALLCINAARAQRNLIQAPATIVDYGITKGDNGNVLVNVSLINSTVKVIKTATLTFEFSDNLGNIVYDIKTGNKDVNVVFHNLKGRINSKYLDEVAKTVTNCYHGPKEATQLNTFTNSTASQVRLIKAYILYEDGTSTNKVAVFQDKSLLNEGPLQPIAAIMIKFDKDETARKQRAGEIEDNRIYDVPQIMPSFKGGNVAMTKWLKDHLVYPADAKEEEIGGRVIVSVVIEKDGSVSNPSILRGVYKSLDDEALRLVKSMPKWFPARQNGKTVRAKYTIMVPFRLE